MKITYERSGGVVGLTRRAVVVTDDLDPAARAEWERLADAVTAAATSPPVPGLRDAFVHTIELQRGDQRTRIEQIGQPTDPRLAALISRLEPLAKRT